MASKNELDLVGGIKTPFEFRVKTTTSNNLVRDYLFNTIFSQRTDEAEDVVRIEESRYYFADKVPIEPESIFERGLGSITIDNKNYHRYMGEMQIVISRLNLDERVNTIGFIYYEDLFLLDYIKGGDKMNFI